MRCFVHIVQLDQEHCLVCPKCGKEMGSGSVKVLIHLDEQAFYMAELFEHCGGEITPVVVLFESQSTAEEQGSRVIEAILSGKTLSELPLLSEQLVTY